MKLTRFIPISVVTLLLMSCVLPSISPLRAGEPILDRDSIASRTASAELTAEQVAETMDYLCSEVTSTVVSLVLTL